MKSNFIIRHLSLICLIFLTVQISLYSQVRLEVKGVQHSRGELSMLDANLHINSVEKNILEYKIKVFKGRQPIDANLLTTSNSFYLESGKTSFRFFEIFSTNDKLFKFENNSIVLFQLVNAETEANVFSYSINTNHTGENNGSRNSEGRIISGDIQASYNISDLDGTDFDPFSNYLSGDLGVNILDVPFNIEGRLTDYRDPLLGKNMSTYSFSYDVNQWKTKQKRRASNYVEKEVLSKFPELENYQSLINKKSYYDKLLSNSSVFDDLGKIDELVQKYENRNPLDLMNHLADSLLGVKEHNQELIQHYENSQSLVTDSIKTVVADLGPTNDSISSEVEKLYLFTKYQQLREEKIKIDSITELAYEKYLLASSYKDKLLNSPSKLKSLVKEHESVSKVDALLRPITTFEVGLINPDYSKYVFKGTRKNGIRIGLGADLWDVDFLYTSILSREFITSDSLFTREVIGGKFKIKNAKTTTEMFYVSALSEDLIDNTPNSIIGYRFNTEYREHKIKFEGAWASGAEDGLAGITPNSFLKSAALDLRHQYSLKKPKISFINEIELIGPSYFDFGNPFIFRNRVNVKSVIRNTLFDYLNLSALMIYQKSNLFGKTSDLNSRRNLGLTLSYSNPKYPLLTYVVQLGELELEDVPLKTKNHSFVSSYSYHYNSFQFVTGFNFNFLENLEKDGVTSARSMNLSMSQDVQISSVLGINANGGYYETELAGELRESIQSYFLELSLPVQYKSININTGLSYDGNQGVDDLGWFMRMNVNAKNKFVFNVDIESNQKYSYFNEFEEQIDKYYSNYRMSLTYKL